jgi:uncharacterized membrane protein
MPLNVRRLFALPSTPGLLLGTLFFAVSLAPSLLPRPFLFQGLVSGISLTLGYVIGIFLRWLWGYLELPLPGERTDRHIKLVAAGVCLTVAAGFLWNAAAWQNDLRSLMGMEEETGIRPISVGIITLLVFSVFLLVTRILYQAWKVISARLERSVPTRVSRAVGLALVLSVFWTVTEGVIFTGALRVADSSYEQLDALIGDDLDRPESALRSGGTDSEVNWEELGRQGRMFVSGGPTAAELEAFLGEPTLEPIRVYVGLRAAGDPRVRAELALRELERTGAFDRSVLVLVTPTGTGWVDPAAVRPVEYLFAGDVATVAAQYSYLSSPLALLAEGAYGAETARALFLEVYGHWSSLPEEDRPELYLHGLSLGALNSSLSFDLQDILADPFPGVLWSGPPFRTEAWVRATRDRDPSTPAWLPEYREGRVVRFMNQDGGLERSDGPWGPLRIAYLQHASDPITFFSVDAFWQAPEWMDEPRGPDLLPSLRWYPLVTGLQLGADMLVGGAPPGFGHTFSVEHYLEAWTALTEPEGWSSEELARLRRHLLEWEAEL